MDPGSCFFVLIPGPLCYLTPSSFLSDPQSGIIYATIISDNFMLMSLVRRGNLRCQSLRVSRTIQLLELHSHSLLTRQTIDTIPSKVNNNGNLCQAIGIAQDTMCSDLVCNARRFSF